MKVIQFKNKKLCERLEQRQALEDELREKIEKLEKRQATDDTTLLIVNRCWTQVHHSSFLPMLYNDNNINTIHERIKIYIPYMTSIITDKSNIVRTYLNSVFTA